VIKESKIQDPVIDTEVLKVLAYFDIFMHPLSSDEILRFLPISATENEVLERLNQLQDQKKVYCLNKYYSLREEKIMEEKRTEGERKANELLKKAFKAGGLISRFPFVRFVGISGSLSKGYADQKTDFDFFIVTASNRLWICRTFLHLFKKLTFLVNKQNYFCMNYFIDETNLEIEDKNIFVLYEIATLLPVYNAAVYDSFISQNKWVMEQLPQFNPNKKEIPYATPQLKKFMELILGIFPLQLLNRAFMKVTDFKWRRKWEKAKYPMEDYGLAFRTRINISKNHPKNYQKLILKHLSDFN
jgi:hypothetical protein